ncbi:MAG: LysR family transcriptional regulator [Pikeienuella sp.]
MTEQTAARRSDFDFNMLRAIEVFMAVAEMNQVTAAAQALGVTQSAASQHLKNLEIAFDVTLFDRSERPLRLTHQGEVLRRRAGRILNEVEDLKSDFRRMSAASIPILRIGMLASIATTLTPGLTGFVSRVLGIPELSLSAGLAHEHMMALNTRRLDMIITSEPAIDHNNFESHPIVNEPFYLILSKKFCGATDDVEAIAKELPFIRFSAEAPVGRRTDQHLQRLRLNLPRVMEADRSSMVVAGVSANQGFAVLSPSLLIDALVEGMPLRIAPLPFAGFRRSISLVARRGELGDLPQRTAAACRTILSDHYERHFSEQSDQIIFAETAEQH